MANLHDLLVSWQEELSPTHGHSKESTTQKAKRGLCVSLLTSQSPDCEKLGSARLQNSCLFLPQQAKLVSYNLPSYP